MQLLHDAKVIRQKGKWSIAGALIATLSCVYAASQDYYTTHPQFDTSDPSILPMFLGACGAGLGLYASALTPKLEEKLVAYLAMLVSGAAIARLAANYYLFAHDFPGLFFTLVMLFVVGCVVARQYWLGGFVGGGVAFLVFPALLSPTAEDAERTVEGLSVRLSQIVRTGDNEQEVRIEISDPQDAELGAYDLRGIDVKASISPLLSLTGDVVREPDPGNITYATIYSPNWARSVTVRVMVPVFPRFPAATVSVPLSKLRSSRQVLHDDVTLERVTRAEMQEKSDNVRDCLLTIKVERPHSSATPYRIVDSLGRVLDYTVVGNDVRADTHRFQVEIKGIPKEVDSLTVELFRSDQLWREVREFTFERMPINPYVPGH